MLSRWPLLPARRRPPRLPTLFDRYWHATHRPLYVLLLVLPLALIYEIGLRWSAGGAVRTQTLVANNILQGVLAWIGASGLWIPFIVLTLTLLIWQAASGGSWRFRPWVLGGMLLESLVAALPLLVLRGVALQAAAGAIGGGPTRAERALIGLGGAVYEELVFRLFLMMGLTVVFAGLLRVPMRRAVVFIVVLNALLFAICHFRPIGVEPFALGYFVARVAAGAYLALVMVTRGLGIAIGCHAAHNVATAAF